MLIFAAQSSGSDAIPMSIMASAQDIRDPAKDFPLLWGLAFMRYPTCWQRRQRNTATNILPSGKAQGKSQDLRLDASAAETILKSQSASERLILLTAEDEATNTVSIIF